MSDLKQKGRQFSDAEYLEEMAKHFDGQSVPELRAHAERLRAIAAMPSAEHFEQAIHETGSLDYGDIVSIMDRARVLALIDSDITKATGRTP